MDLTFSDAFIFAANAHAGHYRLNSKEAFIMHPLRVSELISKWLKDHNRKELLRICALLHDIIEDTWVTYEDLKEKFGEEVADIVLGLTVDSDLRWKDREEEYRKRLVNSRDFVKFLKLADIHDNASEISACKDWGKDWVPYLKKSKETLLLLEIEHPLLKPVFEEKKVEVLAIIDKRVNGY